MTTEKDLPDRIRMPLLDLVATSAMDEDYRHAADRRAAVGEPPARPPRRIAAVVIAVFGLLVVTAAVQTSRNAEVAAAGREELIDQITERREDLQALQGSISDVRTENGEASRELQAVVADDRAVSATLVDLEVVTGFGPVTGPGVRIQLDDAPDGTSNGIVRDEDLAILLDGLWVAGAEAIAVNDHRITATAGIRNVGRAIHISNQPLAPPYTIQAIGNPNTLQARFVDSSAGQRWDVLATTFGFEFRMDNAGGLSLPGASRPQLRSAVRLVDPADSKMEVTE